MSLQPYKQPGTGLGSMLKLEGSKSYCTVFVDIGAVVRIIRDYGIKDSTTCLYCFDEYLV